MKRLIGIIGFILLLSQLMLAQSIVTVDLQKSSSVTITGSTNIVSFKLLYPGDMLPKKNFVITATQNQNRILLGQTQLSIAVKDFTSGNKMALRDFLKLIKSKTYPSIHVQLNYIDLKQNFDKSKMIKGNAYADITITGITKKYCFPISSDSDGENYFLNVRKNISIRDFGLVPPVEMLGLIKVSEWIDLDFHIVCKIALNKVNQTAYNSPTQFIDLAKNTTDNH
ncbi:MAG TPA: YceI family protein [Paludibacter sp.]|nr:YceI family protein [Paludibacter sp.]